MQTIWLNFDHFQKLNVGQDTILGQQIQRDHVKQTWINSKRDKEKHLFNDVVHMKGGEYFFMPSLNTLVNLGA